ncbi:hypothetical protein [Nonomuraea sp. NPDC005650]|uniref:hypothetical protein n=1 Tax=Nonomuraea sp. NPDC005650 TaxID=3157045 RepID=UPI0033A60BDC
MARERNKNHAQRRRARLITGTYRAQFGGQGSRETTTGDIITDLLLGLPERNWLRVLCIALRDAVEERFGEGLAKRLALYAGGLDVPEESLPSEHDSMQHGNEDSEDDTGPRPYTFVIDFFEPYDEFTQEVVVASGVDIDEARGAASRALGAAYAAEGLSDDPLGEVDGEGEAKVAVALCGDVADLIPSVASGECVPLRP